MDLRDDELFDLDIPTLDPDQEEPEPQRRVLRLTVLHHPNPRWTAASWSSMLSPDARALDVGRATPLFGQPDGGKIALEDPHLNRRMVRLKRVGKVLELSPVSGAKRVAMNGRPLRRTARVSFLRLDREPVLLELAGRVLLSVDRVSTTQPRPHGFLGISLGARATRAAIDDHAQMDVPVMVFGEAGSGKGLIARALHDASERAGGPWVELDVHALHVSTDEEAQVPDIYPQTAIPRAFEMALGGTLVIDRIEDADVQAQAQLLAQLKGLMLASGPGWDVGLVTTLQGSPETLATSGRVAHSLLDRLQVGLISVPSLRERREDIPLLLHHFLDRALEARDGWPALASGRSQMPWLGLPLVAELLEHGFPGNVRELSNLAFQIVVHSSHKPSACLPKALQHRIRPSEDSQPLMESPSHTKLKAVRTPQRLSSDRVRASLKRYRWNVTAAARDLGVARNTLLSFIDRTPGFRRLKDIPDDEILSTRELVGDDEQALADELEVSMHGLRLRLSELEDDG